MAFDDLDWLPTSAEALREQTQRARRDVQESLVRARALVYTGSGRFDPDLRRHLEDAVIAANVLARSLQERVVTLALGMLLDRHPRISVAIKQIELDPSIPISGWYQVVFPRNGHAVTLYLTRNVTASHIQSLLEAPQDPDAPVLCINYQPENNRETFGKHSSRAFLNMKQSDPWEGEARRLMEVIETELNRLDALVEPSAEALVEEGSTDRQRELIPANGRQHSPTPASGSDEAAPKAGPPPRLFSEWDGFVYPLEVTQEELLAELEAEFLVTASDPSELGRATLDLWRNKSLEQLGSLLYSAVERIYDPDLLTAFARGADAAGLDDQAEALYRRATEVATDPLHRAHWFWERYRLARGWQGDLRVTTLSDVPAALCSFPLIADGDGWVPGLQLLQEQIVAMMPVGAETGEAQYSPELNRTICEFNSLDPREASLGAPHPSALLQLAEARWEERRTGTRISLDRYRKASEMAEELRSTSPFAADIADMATIGLLRALRRAGEVDEVRSLSRTEQLLSVSQAFRKQAFVIASVTDDFELADRLRKEFLAFRAA